MSELSNGYLVLRDQRGFGSYHSKWNPSHFELDKNKILIELWDNIRICDNENYPTFSGQMGNELICGMR